MSTAPRAGAPLKLWRAFPWEEDAAEGAPFPVRSAPPAENQIGGRFVVEATSALCLGESNVERIDHRMADAIPQLEEESGPDLSPGVLARARSCERYRNGDLRAAALLREARVILDRCQSDGQEG